MQTYIGWWSTRRGKWHLWWSTRRGKWHLIESEVTDRLVMKCGRQMKLETPRGPLIFELEPTDGHCEQCGGKPDQ